MDEPKESSFSQMVRELMAQGMSYGAAVAVATGLSQEEVPANE